MHEQIIKELVYPLGTGSTWIGVHPFWFKPIWTLSKITCQHRPLTTIWYHFLTFMKLSDIRLPAIHNLCCFMQVCANICKFLMLKYRKFNYYYILTEFGFTTVGYRTTSHPPPTCLCWSISALWILLSSKPLNEGHNLFSIALPRFTHVSHPCIGCAFNVGRGSVPLIVENW